MRTVFRLAVCVATAVTLYSVPAAADSIALTGGVLNLQLSSAGSAIGTVDLTGDRGFTFDGSMSGGFTHPAGDPLIPGTTVTFDGGANGLDLGGTATLDGVTYTGVGGLNSPTGGSLRLVTTFTLPSLLPGPSVVSAPFRLDLLFATSPNVSHALLGAGTATISLQEDRGFGVPSWRVTAIRAELSNAPAPTPEPTALLLAVPGLGWIALRVRRTRRACAAAVVRSRRDQFSSSRMR